MDNNTIRYFIAAYLTAAEIVYGDLTYTLHTQEVWADTPEEVIGLLETHPDFRHFRPIDVNNIQVIEISVEKAQEIIAKGPMI